MNQESLYNVILSRHLSEKVVLGTEFRNEYVFKVIDSANKFAVKNAVQTLFNVKVKMVRIVNVRPDQRIFRGKKGTKKGWKKAYVTLQPGEKITSLETQ